MAKIIRPTYPREFSVGMLLLIFALSSFLSFEIFSVKWHELTNGSSPIVGMALSGIAVVIMSLILWEEFLFPVKVRPLADEIVFRNHFTKLRTQLFFYCTIPIIICIVWVNYEVSLFPFVIWAGVCAIAPLGKLLSGIKNYNDFFRISDDRIEYRNNEKHGDILVADIEQIVMIRDESNVLHKICVRVENRQDELIDLDEMELEAYLQTIEEYVKNHYGSLIVERLEKN